MIKRLKTNFSVLKKHFVSYWSALSTFVCLILTFISCDELGINGIANKILALLGIGVLAIILSIISIYSRRSKRIFGNSNTGVSLRYGDLMQYGFPKRKQKNCIVVIPVNRCFDLSCEGNLIASTSIHGQWIKHFIDCPQKEEELHNEICDILVSSKSSFIKVNKKDKKLGYLNRYEPGTVVELKSDKNVIFYLWAVSKLDKNLRASCNEIEYYNAVYGLLDYYDSHGQGVKMYCPITGDRFIRPVRKTNDILNYMISTFKFSKDKIHGQVEIVVYEKMKSDISILEY